MKEGGELTYEDRTFQANYHARLTPDQQEYYRFIASYGE